VSVEFGVVRHEQAVRSALWLPLFDELLINLILGDVAAGRGAVVIDPEGDAVNDVLDRLPATATSRVVLLDPDDGDAPPMLSVLDGADPNVAVAHLIGIVWRIFERFWGPRTDDILRAACVTLLQRPDATLADIALVVGRTVPPPLPVNGPRPGRARRLLDLVPIDDPAQQGQVIGPVMNGLRAFLLRGFVRNIAGRGRLQLRPDWRLDRRGLCSVRVPKAYSARTPPGCSTASSSPRPASQNARRHGHVAK
jgi:hypothetical protein